MFWQKTSGVSVNISFDSTAIKITFHIAASNENNPGA